MIPLKKRFEWRNVGRWVRYKYLQLLRAKGGPHIVALGFSIGLAVEMFTLPTGGLAFFLIFPLVYLFRASLASSLIGFLFGKIIYLPMAFLNQKVGSWVMPKQSRHALLHQMPPWLADILKHSLNLIVGGMIVGAVLGLVLYFPLRMLLKYTTERRKERRRQRKAALHSHHNG
ncbi:hypothetical protein SD70_04495 [Gordoniibacillus kamchatkensis]|uniref:DUF2062 domain-containing protein n=1 Tax=Gordoniibacillus kamchatkensis TaxID=1590651 RepID=A0ABR5ALG5_9BACL|nr:DUF2062 domain-containing protein [Paenibacillus sp. VKM B-2647]KIL41876.1 hypothetical protein SD70_04495 [Paenibacillus sp. VKM B-2647]